VVVRSHLTGWPSSPSLATKTALTTSPPNCSKHSATSGLTIAAGDMTYWVDKAMYKTDYKDLPTGSDKTDQATKTAGGLRRKSGPALGRRPTRAELVAQERVGSRTNSL
jgi:hypothetical protein